MNPTENDRLDLKVRLYEVSRELGGRFVLRTSWAIALEDDGFSPDEIEAAFREIYPHRLRTCTCCQVCGYPARGEFSLHDMEVVLHAQRRRAKAAAGGRQ